MKIINKLKIGLIGLGEQSLDNLIPAILLNKYAVLTAICDLDEEKLRNVGDAYSIENKHQYLDFEELFIMETLDVVVVSSFPDVHYKVAKRCIELGINVFVEKPPTRTRSQLEELATLARQANVKTGVGMNFSYTDAHIQLNKILKEIEFGDLSFLSVEHISSKPNSPLWNFDCPFESFMLAQLIHPLDYIISIGGSIDSIDVYTSNHSLPFIIHLMIKFNSGVIGSLRSGTFHSRFNHQIEVISDNGNMVRINNLTSFEITQKSGKFPYNLKAKNCTTHYETSPLKSGYSKAGYASELIKFFEYILFDSTYKHTFQNLIPVYQAMETITNKTKETKKIIEIPEIQIMSNYQLSGNLL